MWSDVDCGGVLASPVCQRETNETDSTTTTTPWDTTTTTAYSSKSESSFLFEILFPTSPDHVELRGGDGYSYGNVFARNSNDYLGPVCDDSWDNNDVRVVCRQLGFNNGTRYTSSHWGNVPSDFAMDEVACTGSEATIQQCGYRTSDDCGSPEGAGVSCS